MTALPETFATMASETSTLQYVLEPCELLPSIDQVKLREEIANYMKPREKFYEDTKRSYYIEDEYSEWLTKDASDGKEIGKGNSCTDVVTSSKEGIDVMCVIMKGTQTNEKSLIQNFKLGGSDLDSLFKNRDDISAIRLYMEDLKTKLTNGILKYDLCDLYILAYITLSKEIHVCCFKYNINLIDAVVSNGFTKKGESIQVGGFIDERFGNVKLYKAKKRVELRLSKSCIRDNPFAIRIY